MQRMISGSASEICFIMALRDYYPKPIPQKKGKKGSSISENPETAKSHYLLMYNENCWGVVDIRQILPSNDEFQNTIEKVISLDFLFLQTYPEREKTVIEKHLFYWIRHFNSAMMILKLKNKEIKPIAATETLVQFSSMRKGTSWLSNFFTTIIYDPNNQLIYPSVENGYVVFKAIKGSLSREEIFSLAGCLNPKEVKQRGADLWVRSTQEDNNEALMEMNRLVHLKFQQNPLIAEWLKSSSARLQEFTKDAFWGSQLGTLPIEDENSNHLGKILETVRVNLP